MKVLFLTADRLSPRSGLGKYAQVHRGELRSRFGAAVETVEMVPLRDVAAKVHESAADLAVIAVSWDHAPDEVVDAMRAVRESCPKTRVVFFDWYDSSSTPHFAVLPFVDAYAKAQVLRDFAWYEADLAGGYAFTDYLSQHGEVDLTGWYGSAPAREHAGKVVVAWNLGASRTFRRLLRLGSVLRRPWGMRTIDVHCRVSLGEGMTAWYGDHRRAAVAAAQPLAPQYRLAETGRVNRRRYWGELMKSRLVISPFGWGEICYRDFEAMCCGCLLVKPGVGHLRTSPDVFEEFVTYVPVRWDLSDLEEKCRQYLDSPDHAKRIAAEGRRRYVAYFARGGFVDDFGRILGVIERPEKVVWRAGGPLPWRGWGGVGAQAAREHGTV